MGESEMTPALLNAMGQESKTAYAFMSELCALLSTPFPPNPADESLILGRTSLVNLIESLQGETA
jgi:hypothetical protein